MAQSPFYCPSPPRPARAQPRQSADGLGRGNTRRRSDIRAQRAGMILGLSSQNFIRLKKLNDSRTFGSVSRPLKRERQARPLVVGCSAETGSDAGKVFLRAS